MSEDAITLITTAVIGTIGFIGYVMLKFAISFGATLTALYVAHHCLHWF